MAPSATTNLLAIVACVVIGTVTSDDSSFQPGCSFYGEKCIYNIKLGHKGQCDTPTSPSSSTGGCNADLTEKYSKLKDVVDKLETKVDVLTKTISGTGQSNTDLEGKLQKALAAHDDIVNLLTRKEAELKDTKDELAKVMAKAAKEIKDLRQELKTCQSSSGGDTSGPDTGDGPDVGSQDYSLTYFNFNGQAGGFNTQTRGYNGISLLKQGSSSSTGPKADHTLGVTKGSYLGIDSRQIGDYRSRSTPTFSSYSTSGVFPKADGYCVMFWYYMEGTDVKTLSMNIKIKGGEGYPVLTKTGPVNSHKWELAKVDLTSEYTQHDFQITFKMTTNAYEKYSVRGKNEGFREEKSDIAVDDLYVYNTSCANIPRHPTNAQSFYHGNVTSFYTVHVTPMTWEEAYDVCRREGPWASLVSVQTADEQKALVNIIRSNAAYRVTGAKGFYTSGSDADTERGFGWTDSGVHKAFKYSNWHFGQPNNVGGNQDCVLLEYPNADFQWGDVNCNAKHPFICEVEVPGKVTK